MNLTQFHLEHMDCSSEEQMVRMQLAGMATIAALAFELAERRVDIFHEGSNEPIITALEGLNLGASVMDFQEGVEAPTDNEESLSRRVLTWALMINFTLFVGELTTGLVSGSMGLIADSLDMLADAFVYLLSLIAVGGSALRKRRLAAASGYVQFVLAIVGVAEVIRRVAFPAGKPDVLTMIVMSLVALVANIATLLLLRRTKRGEAHIEASWIFTSNDIKVNVLVIIAGGLVWLTSSQLPDLIVGGLIFLIVANGARRILALARNT